MANQNTIWVICSSDKIVDKICSQVDKGQLTELIDLMQSLRAYLEEVKMFCNVHGGNLLVDLYNRQVLEIPISAAEKIPTLIQKFQNVFDVDIAVGIGLTLIEASKAVAQSRISHEIEFYDFQEANNYSKNDSEHSILEPPPNVFDPLRPTPNDNRKQFLEAETVPKPPILRPDYNKELQLEQQLLTAMAQQVMPKQITTSSPQQQFQPKNLLEALRGKVTDEAKEDKAQDHESSQPETTKEELSGKKMPEPVENTETQIESVNHKLANLLATIRLHIPQIMKLSESNPEAFKHVMNLVDKLIRLAHSQKKNLKKHSIDDFEELTKRLNKLLRVKRGIRWIGRIKQRYPVGTRIGRRIKVLVNGREAWRSMSSGRTLDSAGQAISVRSSNFLADHPVKT